jgi:hypothetical protein
VAVTVEKPKILVLLSHKLLIPLALLFEKTVKMDFFDSLASYRLPEPFSSRTINGEALT